MSFVITPNVHVRRDEDDVVRLLRHSQEPYGPERAGLAAAWPLGLAEQYVRDVVGIDGIDDAQLDDLYAAVSDNCNTGLDRARSRVSGGFVPQALSSAYCGRTVRSGLAPSVDRRPGVTEKG